METVTENDSVRIGFDVPLEGHGAFRLFTEGFNRWYPIEYSWSGEALEWIGLEPRAEGKCYEVGPHGFRCDWGRVIEWSPPQRVAFTWHIGFDRVPAPDPARASEIAVSFTSPGEGRTRVDFVHSDYRRHGENWQEYLAAMSSPGGWPYILSRYAQTAADG